MVLISLTFHTRWVTPYSSVTSISGAVVRTTHVTGATTDLGIELANLMVRRAKTAGGSNTLGDVGVSSDLARAGIHFTLLLCFFLGAAIGPLLFVHYGYTALIAPALVLVLIVLGDLATRRLSRPAT